MNQGVVNIQDKLHQITAYWSPKIVAQLNDYHLKLVKVQGDFVWHSHPETDEVFLVVKGELDIEIREAPAEGEAEERIVTLREGELFVVPKGIEHRPIAHAECHVLLIEPATTVNTGDSGGERTVEAEWI